MNKRKIAILGSTGSIGRNCLRLFDFSSPFTENFQVELLTAHTNIDLLFFQVKKYKPKYLVVTDENSYKRFIEKYSSELNNIDIRKGMQALIDFLKNPDIHIVLNAIVGIDGLLPTYHSLLASKKVAIANKETIVVAGKLLKEILKKNPQASLVPVDSEHSALFFLLKAFSKSSLPGAESFVKKIFLTASGGPLLKSKKAKSDLKLVDILKHPNWEMGKKITVDCASLMNKGFEVIEAYRLFPFSLDQIDVVIHPQSYIHGLVETKDSSYYAQMSYPDMVIPIQNAITYPYFYESFIFGKEAESQKRSIHQFPSFDFIPLEKKDYPLLDLSYQILEKEDSYCVVLNAINDLSVDLFLKEKISFLEIEKRIIDTVNKHSGFSNMSLEDILLLDEEIRRQNVLK